MQFDMCLKHTYAVCTQRIKNMQPATAVLSRTAEQSLDTSQEQDAEGLRAQPLMSISAY